MALGMYEQDAVHPLNPDMVGSICFQAALDSKHAAMTEHHCTWLQKKTLELTGKSRSRGVVQPDVARICNIPHKNFFIVVKVTAAHATYAVVPELSKSSADALSAQDIPP